MTRAKCLKILADAGVEFDENFNPDGGRTLYADAPAGFRFTESDTHGLTRTAYPGEISLAYDSLAEDVLGGTEKCPQGGDENCHAYDCPALATLERNQARR